MCFRGPGFIYRHLRLMPEASLTTQTTVPCPEPAAASRAPVGHPPHGTIHKGSGCPAGWTQRASAGSLSTGVVFPARSQAGLATPPPPTPYQLITLQGSGPPLEESILVHSFLGYKLPAHLTHDGQTWELAERQRLRQKVPGALGHLNAARHLPGPAKDRHPEPQRQEAERMVRTGVRLGQLSPHPDGCRL